MRRVVRIDFLLAAALCALVGVGARASPADDAYEQGISAFREGNYELAARRFERVLADRPDWVAGHVTLGQCYYLLGQQERAEESFGAARSLAPHTDLFEAYFAVGQTLYGEKRFDLAIAPLARALENAPVLRRQQVSIRLGHAMLLAGRHDEARRALEDHVGEHGSGFAANHYLALACQKLADYDCAVDRLRAAAATEEGRGRQLEELLARWSHYRALLPENSDRRQELLARAVEDARAWFVAAPGDPVAAGHWVETLLAAGRGDEAVQHLAAVARRDARNCAARTLLAKTLNSLEESADAERWARRAVECDAASAAAHVELAVALIRQVRPEHSGLDELRVDVRRMRDAVASLDLATGLASGRNGRWEGLCADARLSLERLEQAEAELVASDRGYRDAVDRARLEEVREHCRTLIWKRRDANTPLTADEAAFFRENDCERYVPRDPGKSGGNRR